MKSDRGVLVSAAVAVLGGVLVFPAAALADRGSRPHMPDLGVLSAASASLDDPPGGTPDSCGYGFDSEMPAATFCVYRGVVLGAVGEECADDIVVLWSTFQSPSPLMGSSAESPSAWNSEVFLGFVADPGLVIRAIADPRRGDRAEIVDYTLGSGQAPRTLAGKIGISAPLVGEAEVLSVVFDEARSFRPGGCAVGSYSGRFLGMMRPPSGGIGSAAIGP